MNLKCVFFFSFQFSTKKKGCKSSVNMHIYFLRSSIQIQCPPPPSLLYLLLTARQSWYILHLSTISFFCKNRRRLFYLYLFFRKINGEQNTSVFNTFDTGEILLYRLKFEMWQTYCSENNFKIENFSFYSFMGAANV